MVRLPHCDILKFIPALRPIHFFSLHVAIPYVKHKKRGRRLPLTTSLLDEVPFAQVDLGWNEEEITCTVHVDHPMGRSFFPDFSKGEAMELFFDTRDMKTAGFATRFCHHFLLLPAAALKGREITHFRTEDRHPLCDAQEIEVVIETKPNSYTVEAIFPRSCLHGFDPVSFDRMGFAYCMHSQGRKQHFSISSEDVLIAQHPKLWASLELKK